MSQDTILQLQDLHTYFPIDHTELPAVNGVSLNIEKGKVLALVGESGCGKKMTALSILWLVPPPGRIVSGKILFNGKNLLNLTEPRMQKIRGKEIPLIFQELGLALNRLLESIPKMDKAQKRLPAIPGQVPDIANLSAGCAFHPRCSLPIAQCKTKIPQPREITTGHWICCDII